jgi:hypothetical protein
MKPISKELREALDSTPKVSRKIEAYYDLASLITRALVTYTSGNEIFTSEVDLCYGPIIGLSEVWLGPVRIPMEEITLLADRPIAGALRDSATKSTARFVEATSSRKTIAGMIEAADAYILALRQAFYGNPDKPEVRNNAIERLNACGQRWTMEREKFK